MVAVLSDQNGYFDINILDAMTGEKIKKLIKGNRGVDFEELKWLQPGLSWSPDSKKIVFAAKAGKGDVLHVVEVETGKGEKYELDIEGVFSASWSPLGNEIAYVGQSGNSSDIYIFDLNSQISKKITDDIFSDAYPTWSGDGKNIAFVSDRGNKISGEYDGFMYEHDYSQTDIYSVNVETKIIDRLTNSNHNESHPVWSKTSDNIFYTSDHNGVWNLYRHPISESEDSEPIPVTNVLTGLQQPTISGDDRLLIFAGYSGIGWDLYSMANPLTLKKQTVNPTQFILNGKTENESIADLRKHKSNMMSIIEESNKYADHVLAKG